MSDIDFPTTIEWSQDDAISAGSATMFMTIGGRNVVLASLKSINAKIKKNKKEVRVVGHRAVGSKATSWNGVGNIKLYDTTSAFREVFVEYINQGVDTYFSINVVNEDPKRGREAKLITGCNFDEIDFAQADDDDSFLEQDMPFTFDGAGLLEKYKVL